MSAVTQYLTSRDANAKRQANAHLWEAGIACAKALNGPSHSVTALSLDSAQPLGDDSVAHGCQSSLFALRYGASRATSMSGNLECYERLERAAADLQRLGLGVEANSSVIDATGFAAEPGFRGTCFRGTSVIFWDTCSTHKSIGGFVHATREVAQQSRVAFTVVMFGTISRNDGRAGFTKDERAKLVEELFRTAFNGGGDDDGIRAIPAPRAVLRARASLNEANNAAGMVYGACLIVNENVVAPEQRDGVLAAAHRFTEPTEPPPPLTVPQRIAQMLLDDSTAATPGFMDALMLMVNRGDILITGLGQASGLPPSSCLEGYDDAPLLYGELIKQLGPLMAAASVRRRRRKGDDGGGEEELDGRKQKRRRTAAPAPRASERPTRSDRAKSRSLYVAGPASWKRKGDE